MEDALEPGLIWRMPEPPRKVALVKPARIGDFICTIPAVRALRASLQDAEITMITLPLLEDLVRRSPHLDRFEAFPGYPGMAEQFFEAGKTLRFFEKMQAEHFDLAIQFQGSGVYSNPFTLMLGARATAGFVRPGETPGRLEAALPWPERGHEVQRMLDLAVFLGAPAQGEQTEFPLWPEDHATVTQSVRAEPPWIGLHPAARDLTRRWSPERFAAVGAALQKQYGGSLIVIGEAEEREAAEQILEMAAVPGMNLAGHTPLAALGALIDRLAVLVTNDTGPAHIAYALGTPTVTIFGGADPQRYGPPQEDRFRMLAHAVPCRPCSFTECPIGYVCLVNVTVDQVLEAARQVIRLSWR